MSAAHGTLEEAMIDDDLGRIEELFQTAADLPADRRPAFLEGECVGQAAVRTRVEELLDRLDRDDSLASPAFSGGPFPAAAITEGPGAVIDRYKLLQVIGEGGFGVVYMAEQQQPVVRKVALKIIKLGMDTKEVVARFEAERQALALMDHPNIARVLDGGATESGRPYFVMELVRGVAITEYCDKNNLTTRARLELFEQVCHALQHAHQKGVIHRDLKPTNVLVTLLDGRSVPKVIDFGVAKAMHTRLTEKTLFTQYEQFIGTPAYMSPEQAEMSALDVDTRTDIYSLGVLLYELLTGTTPFDTDSLMRAGLLGIQRIIREEQPPRPSLRISSVGNATVARRRGLDIQGLTRHLRGDIDWIVMKALEKERSRRYATANAFAEDIRRYLRKEPVLAGPPGAAYRLRKFLARNRAVVISATLVVLALVAGIVGTTLAKMESDRNAALARRQADHALSALDFLVSTLALTNPEVALDPDVTVRTLLEHTSARVADAFAGQPWAEVRVRSTIGRAYKSLSEDELAEPHLRRAVELVDALTAGRGPAEAFRAAGYDAVDFYTTLWTLTNVCFNLERADAFAIAQRARQVGLDHIGMSHPELADALRQFVRGVEAGAWSLDPDAMKGVVGLFEESAALAGATLPPGDPLWPIVADTYLAAGYTVWYSAHESLSEHFFAEALEIQQRELAPDHPDIAISVGLLVGILNVAGKSKEAEELIRSSIDSLRRVHREGAYPIAVAESMLGENLVTQGRLEEAEALLLGSHEVTMATVKHESHFMAIESFIRLVQLYEAWERPEAAAPYRDSIARTGSAAKYVVQWSIARYAFGPEHGALVEVMDRVKAGCGGVNYLVAPGSSQAPGLVALLQEMTVLRAALLDGDDPRSVAVARLLLGWANALSPADNVEARRLMATDALGVLRRWQDELPVDTAEALALLADAERDRGHREEARRLAREAWQVLRGAEGVGMWFTTAAKARIARTMLSVGFYEEAESLLRPNYERFAAQLGDHHSDTMEIRRLLLELYTAWGRPEDARRFKADS